MYFLLYQGIIFVLIPYLISVVAVDGDGSDLYGLNKYHVLHNPNYNIHAKTDPFETGNTIGMKFERQHAVYMLNNENTVDEIVYGGMALANIPYRYLVFNSNGSIVDQELFFRKATNSTTFDVFNREEARLDHTAVEYVKVKFSYSGESDEVDYISYLNRTAVHPFTEVYTLHIKAGQDDLDTMHKNVLDDITIPVECTRLTPEVQRKYTNAQFSVDGITQRLWKKLSYKLDLPGGQSINGFRKFKLHSLSSDPSYIRERIYYDMLNVAKIPGAKGSYVRLFINSVPQGLYLLIDRYESPFLENVFKMTADDSTSFDGDNRGHGESGWNHYKNKNAMKKHRHSNGKKQSRYHKKIDYVRGMIDGDDEARGGLVHGQVADIQFNNTNIEGSTLQYKGMQPSAYVTLGGKELYDVVEDSTDGDTMDALIAFMSFIESTKSITLPNPVTKQEDIEAQNKLVDQWNTYFDVSIFLKNVGIDLFMSNTDSYAQSGTNYYLYQDISQNGRFVYMPYNVDLIMGSTLFPAKNGSNPFQDLDRYRTFTFLERRPLLKQILAVPLFNERFHTILKDYYSALFESSAVGNYLAYIKELIRDDVGWDRALFRFRTSNFVGKEKLYEQLLENNLFKYPLGRNFMLRQDIIPFGQAVRGPIRDTPSLIGVYEHFNTTMHAMAEFATFMSSHHVTNITHLYVDS